MQLTGDTRTPDLRYGGKTGLAPADYFKGLTFGLITGSEDTI